MYILKTLFNSSYNFKTGLQDLNKEFLKYNKITYIKYKCG